MSVPASNVMLIKVVEGSADLADYEIKSGDTVTPIKRLDIINNGAGNIVLDLGDIGTKTIGAGLSWGHYMHLQSFSLTATSNAYSLDIGV